MDCRRRREEGKSKGRKGGNEGREKETESLLEIGDFFFSFHFLKWELRKLHSIMPKVPLHA